MNDLRLNWNWGVPDYLDASAYPGPDDLSDGEWRWEFIRRSNAYRQIWLLNVGRALSSRPLSEENKFLKEHEENQWRWFKSERANREKYGVSDPAFPREDAPPWNLPLDDPDHRMMQVYSVGASYFGINCIYNPAMPRNTPRHSRGGEVALGGVDHKG